MGILDMLRGKKKGEKVYLPIANVKGSRGIFIEKGVMPIAHISVVTTDGEEIILEFDHGMLAELIKQASYTYEAIMPKHPTRRNVMGGWYSGTE